MSLASGLAIAPLASFESQAWRNGGGTTRALAEAADRGWRISLADVSSDGPYSRFPGMDRMSLVIRGAGVELRHEAREVVLAPGRAARYDGEFAWQATLRDGPVVALNAMVVRTRFRARMVPLRETTFVAGGPFVPFAAFALVLPLGGRCAWRTPDMTTATPLESDAVLMRPMDGADLWLTPLDPAVDGEAAVLVLIEPLARHFIETEGTVT
ncbi:MAG TPA: HutD family protein [Paraburkholderia sp.]|uniref:HutD/Ves family protein n=1 Tax=Paraburkholderia sp. TaxID=1926495 RepID=UPI002ED4C895